MQKPPLIQLEMQYLFLVHTSMVCSTLFSCFPTERRQVLEESKGKKVQTLSNNTQAENKTEFTVTQTIHDCHWQHQGESHRDRGFLRLPMGRPALAVRAALLPNSIHARVESKAHCCWSSLHTQCSFSHSLFKAGLMCRPAEAGSRRCRMTSLQVDGWGSYRFAGTWMIRLNQLCFHLHDLS